MITRDDAGRATSSSSTTGCILQSAGASTILPDFRQGRSIWPRNNNISRSMVSFCPSRGFRRNQEIHLSQPHTHTRRDATRATREYSDVYVTRCHRRAASTRLVNERGAFRLLFAIHVTRDSARVVAPRRPLSLAFLSAIYIYIISKPRANRDYRRVQRASVTAIFATNIQRLTSRREARLRSSRICQRIFLSEICPRYMYIHIHVTHLESPS